MRPSFRFEGIVYYVAQLLKPLVGIFDALAVIQMTVQKQKVVSPTLNLTETEPLLPEAP